MFLFSERKIDKNWGQLRRHCERSEAIQGGQHAAPGLPRRQEINVFRRVSELHVGDIACH
jgi:hypothetical protein